GSDPRFADTEESVSAVLRFPGERLASFVVSFGAASVSTYAVVGTKGSLVMDSAYAYADEITQTVTVNGRSRERTFPKHDQFAVELVSFSECIMTGEDPEPSGWEGLADVRVIAALYRSIETGRPVELPPFRKDARPSAGQAIRKPSVRQPKLVNTETSSE
ncbi:MAG: Gfo/Idh/MocA family oxidoreductase, partial [Gemmatimonadota bacterium]